jgi:single-strand DNA-binding protein
MNVVMVSGNLTDAPTVISDKLVKYTVACDSYVGGEKKTSFFEVLSFHAQGANDARYLAKGSKVAIQGSLNQSRWTSKDGKKMTSVQILAERVEYLSPQKKSESIEVDFVVS